MYRAHPLSPFERRTRRKLAPPLVLALLGLSACTEGTSDSGAATRSVATRGFEAQNADEPRALDETDRLSSATAKLAAKDLAPDLLEANYDGDLCPPDSLTVEESGDGSAFTIKFSTALHAKDESLEGRCQIRLRLAVPKESSFGNVYLYGSGFTAATHGGANLQVDYGFALDGSKQTLSKTFDHDESEYAVYEVMDEVWSPTCGSEPGAEQTELVLDVRAGASGDAYFGLGALDFGLSYIDGARWIACEDRAPLIPAPSEEDEPCAGPPRHACAEGLECDVFDSNVPYDELLTGVCTKAGTRLPPMPQNGPCNGLRDIQCDEGMICHYTTAARAATKSWNGSARTAKLMGMCQPRVGRDADPCAGYPNITCDTGHFCSELSGDVCKAADGQLDSNCEDGIAACASELVCQNRRCAVPMASEGAACGGPLGIRCISPTVCDVEQQRCVPDLQSGGEGTNCWSEDDCDPGLVCYAHACRASIKGLGGTSCEQHEDCNPGFRCSQQKCWPSAPGNLRGACDAGDTCRVGLACVAGTCVAESDGEMGAAVPPTEPPLSALP